MRKTSVVVIVCLIAISCAIAQVGQSAEKKMRSFKWHPEQKKVAVSKVEQSWAKLTKGKSGWHLYTVKGVSLVSGGMMKVMLVDKTGLTHEVILTQPQWLGLTEATVETNKGMMVGTHEIGDEIIAFASPMSHW